MNETNTKKSFSDKWNNNKNLAFENTLKEGSEIQNWILSRNGWSSLSDLKYFLKDKTRVLDAGCGNGRVTKLLRNNSSLKTEIVGIDLVAHKIAKENLKDSENVSFYEKDLLNDLGDLGSYDFIYSQEVLHHTKNPYKSFENLVKLLNKDGIIAIYVYKKKAPVREYTDDYVRDIIKDYDYNQAMRVSDDITKLGKVLSELNFDIDIPELKELGIKQGKYSVQRFLYHFFMKCYWNDDLSFSENSAINYDWYHPQDCSRHTLEEIKEWFSKLGLNITHVHEDFYGITIHGKK